MQTTSEQLTIPRASIIDPSELFNSNKQTTKVSLRGNDVRQLRDGRFPLKFELGRFGLAVASEEHASVDAYTREEDERMMGTIVRGVQLVDCVVPNRVELIIPTAPALTPANLRELAASRMYGDFPNYTYLTGVNIFTQSAAGPQQESA